MHQVLQAVRTSQLPPREKSMKFGPAAAPPGLAEPAQSGLPDFRGNEGFWRAYPPFAKLGLSFVELANPRWFDDDPALAWGFYGHRYNLYTKTRPHEGFAILKRWADRPPHGAFVYTSNVDGHSEGRLQPGAGRRGSRLH